MPKPIKPGVTLKTFLEKCSQGEIRGMTSELIRYNNAEVNAISWHWFKGHPEPGMFLLKTLLMNQVLLHLFGENGTDAFGTQENFEPLKQIISEWPK